MREDYTRKTQKLAEFRKTWEAELAESKDVNEETMGWLKSWENPDVMEAELDRYFPKAYQALRNRIIDQTVEEDEASTNPRHLEALKTARKAELAERQRRIDEEIQARRTERQAVAQKSAKLREDFTLWTREAMDQAGLQFDSEKHRTAFTDRIMSAHGKEPWSRETFSKTAKHVADLLGIKPKRTDKKADKKAAPQTRRLPPVAKRGAVAPLGGKQPKKTPVPGTSAEGFEALRKKHGLL